MYLGSAQSTESQWLPDIRRRITLVRMLAILGAVCFWQPLGSNLVVVAVLRDSRVLRDSVGTSYIVAVLRDRLLWGWAFCLNYNKRGCYVMLCCFFSNGFSGGDLAWSALIATHRNMFQTYKALVLSTFLFAAEAWTLYLMKMTGSLRVSIGPMNWQHQILGIRWQDHVRDADVANHTGLPTVSEHAVKRRNSISVTSPSPSQSWH